MLRGIAKVLPFAVPCSSGQDGKRISSSVYKGRVRVLSLEGKSVAEDGERSIRGVDERGKEDISWAKASGSFVKPLSDLYPRLPCRFCKGQGEVICDICDGKGKFNRGGYHKKNPVSVERIIGSKWTAMEAFFGWRYFQIQSKRRGSRKEWFVEMVATCDETGRYWMNVQNLKDRERWSMGWLQKVEILEAQNKDTASNLVCKACKGKGQQPCSCTLRDPDETILDIIEV
ncbi:unnamed protein product [Calypogeia fissa]